MPNSSSTGGYLLPTTPALPGSLTLDQFLHNVIVGISGYATDLVRPKWQAQPPPRPIQTVNWIAFALQDEIPDANAYLGLNDAGTLQQLQRQVSQIIQVSFYGPNCMGNASAFRDGFQLQQNLDGLRTARMAFTACSNPTRAPEKVNEVWYDRCELTLVIARQVVRTYQVISFASAEGTIHTDLETPITLNWVTPDPPEDP